MYKEYNARILKKLQETELKILKDFILVCEKYNLNYFAMAGTAIGAVRHHGFIPWDDDIDIGMLREDYNRFLKVAEKELSDKYEIVTADRNEEYPLMNMRLVLKETKCVHYSLRKLHFNQGISIDVAIYDNVSPIPNKQKLQMWKALIWYKIMILHVIPNPVLPYDSNDWKVKYIYFVCNCIHLILKLIGVKKHTLLKKCMKVSLEYENTSTDWVCNLSFTNPKRCLIRKNDIFPLKKEKFEDILINIPKNNDKVLKTYCGDYMKLPPVEKRKNHPPVLIQFEDGEKIIFEK